MHFTDKFWRQVGEDLFYVDSHDEDRTIDPYDFEFFELAFFIVAVIFIIGSSISIFETAVFGFIAGAQFSDFSSIISDNFFIMIICSLVVSLIIGVIYAFFKTQVVLYDMRHNGYLV